MLRAIGSTRGQVIRAALAEALLVGIVFSVVGVLTGIGLARGLAAIATTFGGDLLPQLVFSLPPRAIILPILVGVVIVVAAALRPVIRSSRAAPLEALRADAALTMRSRAGAIRIGLGLLFLVAGGIGLLISTATNSVIVGVLGGLVSFTGVIMSGALLVPLLTRAIGVVAARPFGAAGRLAIENAVRNPARAAATASALLVGITLVSMTAVGAATAKSSITEALDERYPVDVVVRGADLTSDQASSLRSVGGVRAAVVVEGTRVQVADSGAGQEATSQEVIALPTEAEQVARTPGALDGADAGAVELPESAAVAHGLTAGDEISLKGPEGRERLRVEIGGAGDQGWLVSPETLRALDATPSSSTMYLRLAEDADADQVLADVGSLTAGMQESSVGGAAQARAANMQSLNIALAVVLGLLAIAVIIAIVGIANTLSLSVMERARESALMRALGLTHGQLRAMLAIEAGLLALVGVIVGTLLGPAYGYVGVRALVGGLTSVSLTMPWLQLIAVAVVAVTAGLLASVLPARRAAKVSPAAALAAE